MHDQKKGTSMMGNDTSKHRGNTSGNMTNCNVSHKQRWTMGTNFYSLPLGKKFHPLEKANAIADCLEKQFTPHDLCEENHEWHVEAGVQALLKAVDNDPLKE
jgi:hypothetical protein